MSISSKGILVNISVSQWSGRKLDRRATATVAVSFSAEAGSGNYTKKLLPGAKELDAVQREASAMRAFFHHNTLPWCTDGSRILSSMHYLEFTAEYRKRKAAFDSAVEAFIAAYPTLKAEAQAKLGNLFNAAEYPSEKQLRNAFGCEITMMPIPDVADFRVDITESEKAEFLEKMRVVETEATRECWNRLYGVISKAAEKLQSPDAIFRDSLLENITELCGLLPKLNITGDAVLEEMRASVESLVANTSPDTVRADSGARNDAAKALADIQSKMSAIMGGFPASEMTGEKAAA